MPYRKEIETTQTGMVIAKVVDEGTGRCVGLEFFHTMFNTNAKVQRLFEKAHAWADGRIEICEQYERGMKQ